MLVEIIKVMFKIKVEVFSDSDSSPTRTLRPLYLQIAAQDYTESDLNVLDMDTKLTTIALQCHWFHLKIHPKSLAIAKTRQSPKSIFGAASPFWPVGPCIELDSI